MLTDKTSFPIVPKMRTKKPRHAKKSYVVALRIELEIGQKIEDLADAKQVPVGQILRWAILKYIEDEEIHSREKTADATGKRTPQTNSGTDQKRV